jgi:hypothetical protein
MQIERVTRIGLVALALAVATGSNAFAGTDLTVSATGLEPRNVLLLVMSLMAIVLVPRGRK